MNGAGKVTYVSALASPIIITYFYMSKDWSLFGKGATNNVYVSGNAFSTFFGCLLIWVFVYYPLDTVIGYLVQPYISHIDLLRKHYLLKDDLYDDLNVSQRQGSEEEVMSRQGTTKQKNIDEQGIAYLKKVNALK